MGFGGERVQAFRQVKLRLEYEWTRLWVAGLGKRVRANASGARLRAEESRFERWVASVNANRTFARIGGEWVKNPLFDAGELARRERWNRENRRVVDIKPVLDREGAAREVLKYITKVAMFADQPEAIKAFLPAVRGARLVQTFGSWYGVKLESSANEHDWSEMQCACGCNDWKRVGVFFIGQVGMDEAGRWFVRDSCEALEKPRVPIPSEIQVVKPEVYISNDGEIFYGHTR